MKKIFKILIFFVIFLYNLNFFYLIAYATNSIKIDDIDDIVKYNGSIEELPEYIYESYSDNIKADSLDIYDQNLYSITTNNTDGTKTVQLYQTPIKYIENEEIKFIDTTLEKLPVLEQIVSQYFYECTKTPVKSYFPNKLTNGILIENENYKIKCSAKVDGVNTLEKIFSKPTLSEENVLIYKNVFNYADTIAYTPVSNGIKEEIILEEYTGQNIFEFSVELSDLEPLCFEGDSIPLIDKKTKEIVASIGQIDMRDSSQGVEFNTSLFNHLNIEKIEDDVYSLKIILDEDFLKSESTIYPVIVDPTITFDADPIYDAPVFSGYPTKNFNSNTYNVVGYHGSSYGEGISFVKINNIQEYVYIKPSNITSAYFKVYEGSGKTSSATVEIYDTKATWSNTSITYDDMPDLKADSYSSKTISESGWYKLKITSLVRSWLRKALKDGGKSQNYGFALKMSKEGVSSRHFCSANHSTYPPSIIINYTEDTSLSEGEYYITSDYSGLMLDTELDESACGNVIQYGATANNNQIWKIEKIGNGYYELHSKYYSNEKSLCVTTSKPVNGTNVTVYDSSAGDNLKFRIIKNADGSYRILSVCGSKIQGLDVCGPSLAATANIQTWTYSGVTQQRWNFYKVASKKLLSHWDCDSDMIAYHESPIKIFVEKSADFGKSISTLKSYVNYSLQNWVTLGFSYSFVDSSSDCSIRVKGITRSEATELFPSSNFAYGITTGVDNDETVSTFMGYAVSPDGLKKVYNLECCTLYVIWDDEGVYGAQTSNFTTSKWRTMITHEMGHALGFLGHTTTCTLMYSVFEDYYDAGIREPNTTNINHMKTVY